MSKKSIWIGLAILVVIVLIILVTTNSGSTISNENNGTSAGLESINRNTVSTSTNSSVSTTTSSTVQSYTLAQIATHNNAQSCWTTINGGVYDITNWINQHPGGPQAILSLCGKDGSAAFNGQHGGQARPASELATFKIGVLAQ
jgi:cytochrome b involved in lipid metabolism